MTPRETLSWFERNRGALGMIGAALAAVVGGLWTAYIHFFPAPEPKSKPAPSQVESSCGGVAVGGDMSGGTITTGNSGDCAKSKPKAQP